MTKVSIKCKTCKKDYLVKPYRLKRGSNYCSRKCYSDNHKTDLELKTGYRRKSKGYAIHQKVWMKKESFHVIPKGFIVHHINGKTLNNRPNNLTLLPKRYHDMLHQKIRKSEGRLILPEV